MTQRPRLGDMLVQSHMLTPDKLDQALALQGARPGRLGEILVEEGFVTENQLTQTLSNQLSVPWVSLHHVDFTRALLNHVPRELAERWCVVPVYVRAVRRDGDTLFVAMDDPTNEEAIAAVSAAAGLPVRPMVAAPSDIRQAIRAYYGGQPAPAPRAQPALLGPAPAVPAPAVPAPAVPAPERPVVAAPVAPAPAPAVPAPPTTAPPLEPALPLEPAAPRETPSAGLRRTASRPRMIAITLLDGTSIALPSPGEKRIAEAEQGAPAGVADTLTAADLVAALRARAAGADVSAVLGDATWESMFAALLSVLLKKHLIADWEFVEEWKKHRP